MACGQKFGKILVENLREYFRVVFAVSALFSQYNHFFGLRKDAKGAKGAKIGSLRERLLGAGWLGDGSLVARTWFAH